jgi:hypothetical protein
LSLNLTAIRAEKELENDPQLLSYRAKPQIEFPVTHRPSARIMRRFARLRAHKLEVIHMHDAVVTINNTKWPAYRKRNGTLVDLRILDPDDRSPKPRLAFRPDKLRDLGIPAALIDAAEQSEPQGFVLFEDLPGHTQRENGSAHNATTEPGQELNRRCSCRKKA